MVRLLRRGLGLRAQRQPDATTPPSAEELLEQVDALARRARDGDPEALVRLVDLRHRAGVALVADPPAPTEHVSAAEDLGDVGPELPAAELTAGHLRAAILRHGYAVVRGIIPREEATSIGADVDRLYAEHGDLEASSEARGADYQLFVPEPGHSVIERPWVRAAGGVWL